MRKDFGRVVIERARRGSSCPNLKMRKTGRFNLEAADWNEWDYDGPLKIRTNGIGESRFDHKLGEKDFTDVLGPLNGYLTSSVGCRWDDVYSDLSRTLGRGGHAMRHVFTQHALRDVCTATYVENGKVFAQPYDRGYGPFFLDPRDGTLREEVRRSRKYKARKELRRRYWKEGLWFVWIRGIWYLGCYTPASDKATDLPKSPAPPVKKDWLGLPYTSVNTREHERERIWPNLDTSNGKRYFVKWKQAGKKDLKALRILSHGVDSKNGNHHL